MAAVLVAAFLGGPRAVRPLSSSRSRSEQGQENRQSQDQDKPRAFLLASPTQQPCQLWASPGGWWSGESTQRNSLEPPCALAPLSQQHSSPRCPSVPAPSAPAATASTCCPAMISNNIPPTGTCQPAGFWELLSPVWVQKLPRTLGGQHGPVRNISARSTAAQRCRIAWKR